MVEKKIFSIGIQAVVRACTFFVITRYTPVEVCMHSSLTFTYLLARLLLRDCVHFVSTTIRFQRQQTIDDEEEEEEI